MIGPSRLLWQSGVLAACTCVCVSAAADAGLDEEFHEELYIRPLADGKVVSHFEFTTVGHHNAWEGTTLQSGSSTYHTGLLPRSLAAIVRAYDVEEVYLSLTTGRWDYERWQETVGHGSPSGGEIYAWLSSYEGEDDATAQKKWTGLTNSLGGLFCSSLNKLDDKMTVSPVKTFSPTSPQSQSQPFFHAILPLERPCTENLTPFISLLPCRSASGLAQLLNPHKLFDANWQRLLVHIVKDIETGHITIKLSVEVVQDPIRMSLAAGTQPRRDWSFDNLFGRNVERSCPVASTSRIIVDLSKEDEESGYSLEPKASEIQLPTDDSVVFDVNSINKPLSLHMRWPVMRSEGFQFPLRYKSAELYAERVNTGYGLERATLGISITNTASSPQSAIWLEEWPSWIKVYLHTLRVEVNGIDTDKDSVVRKMLYTQARPRGSPTVMEASLMLPPHSTTRLVLDIDRAYLRYTDYPPDPHRGFDVPSGMIVGLLEHENGTVSRGSRIYTTTSLLDMPTPDFSMPYNVIILTCTVIALFFGSVFNMMTRTWMLVDLRDKVEADRAAIDAATSDSSVKEPPSKKAKLA